MQLTSQNTMSTGIIVRGGGLLQAAVWHGGRETGFSESSADVLPGVSGSADGAGEGRAEAPEEEECSRSMGNLETTESLESREIQKMSKGMKKCI